MIDLQPYTAKGFPGNLDHAIANVGVRGIDREQAQSMVRLCPATEAELYEGNYSPRAISYRKGTRPVLEALAELFPGDSAQEYAVAAMQWVQEQVVHPYLSGPLPPDRAMTEEALIESKRGWCNEQARVFIALCQVREIPARLCFINHVNAVCGHTCAEVFLDGRWSFFDVTFNLTVRLPGDRLAEGREIAAKHREAANSAYRQPLQSFYQCIQPFAEENPGWRSGDRPEVGHGGDLFDSIGICNYLIEGVCASKA